jgi:hypothetical protein
MRRGLADHRLKRANSRAPRLAAPGLSKHEGVTRPQALPKQTGLKLQPRSLPLSANASALAHFRETNAHAARRNRRR